MQDMRTPVEINITHRVRLLPAARVESCWAAAAEMLYDGARPRAAQRPEPVITNQPDVDDQTSPSAPPHQAACTLSQFAREWGLEVLPPQDWTVSRLADALRPRPLWAGAYLPNGHAMVITGLFGDGSPGGTYVTALDPWPAETGTVHRLPYAVWARRYSAQAMHMLYRPARVTTLRSAAFPFARELAAGED
jgi:hypothetical protein